MDVGFFTECVRPVSQQRIQFTSYRHMTNYDRNSYKSRLFPLGQSHSQLHDQPVPEHQ